MKKTRLFASFLAIIMIMMTFSSAFAATPSANFIVENDIDSTGITLKNKTFNLYQVFSAEATESVSETAEDSIEYFVNPDFYDFFETNASITYPDDPTDADYDDQVDTYNHQATEFIQNFTGEPTSSVETFQQLADLLRKYIIDEGLTPTSSTSDYSLSGTTYETVTAQNVSLGYYAVFENLALGEGSVSADDVVTRGSLVTIPKRGKGGSFNAPVTIKLKNTAPKIDKDIWHNDRSNVSGDNSLILGTTGRWDGVADYQIGDTVEFRITVDVPANVSAYETYDFIITDTLSDGLSFNNDIEIYTDPGLETEPVSGNLHTTTYGETSGEDYTFQMDFKMKEIKAGFKTMEKFYVYYTATVTKDAAIYTSYEDNNVTLDFSNNPYDKTSHGHSQDTVYGYTFDLDVTKTIGDGITALKDVKFALYEVKSGDTSTYTQIYLEKDTNASLTEARYFPSIGTASDTLGSEAGIITTDASGKFTISGLDDAKTYELVELEAPAGYNKADPIRMTITAKYANNSAGIPVPTLTIAGDTDSLDLTVINTSARLLPETGGIGTTIFTTVGIVLMLGAVVLLVVNKKRKAVK